jgi:hypothetical protein
LLAQDEVIINLSKNDRIQLLKESYKKLRAKQQHPEVYGLMGFTNNALFIGRIMLKENYAPFVEFASKEARLNEILQFTIPSGKEYISKILEYAEKYLEQK